MTQKGRALIYLSRREMPASLAGYSLWLQVRDAGEWSVVCELNPTAAKEVGRWLDRHPLRREVRVLAEKV